MEEICAACNEEKEEVCGDGYCRECHVSLSFDDCVNGTWLARQNIAKGRSIESTKAIYPNAEV